MAAFEEAIGRKTLGNVAVSGTTIIQRLGDKHRETGYPIVYTSEDSVFQIAAHLHVIPIDQLYTICQTAREILAPPHGVCRVIARPFTGTSGHYRRTDGRYDFSISPPGMTLINFVKDAGHAVIGIGKIEDLSVGSGLTGALSTPNNRQSVAWTSRPWKTSRPVLSSPIWSILICTTAIAPTRAATERRWPRLTGEFPCCSRSCAQAIARHDRRSRL